MSTTFPIQTPAKIECLPTDHAFTAPTIVKTKIGRNQEYSSAVSICSKCGLTKRWPA